ncbi:MAG TPA: hypothetical protein VNW04_01960 [Puia sp.]|nr:hypothetical protein [Puia sp.]
MNRTIYILCLLISAYISHAQPLEKIFVHTDKDSYLAGEILWLKLYVVDAASRRPQTLSRSAFIEILSDDQKPVLQTRVAIDTGLGNASFQLPFSLHSGRYRLRAYTSWMKNASPETWFEKPLVILNTLRSNPPPAATPPAPPYDIQFFPEGGNLIAGIPNHIAFRIVDSTGKGIPCSGSVFASGDTLLRFQTQRFGMGEFTLTPGENIRYTAIVYTAGQPAITHPLPAAETTGYAMHIADAGNGTLRIEVHTGSPSQDQTIRLLGKYEAPLTAGNASFTINKDSLSDGVTWFTVLAGNGLPLCERGWFKAPVLLKMTAGTDQPTYTKREKITLDLSTRGNDNQPLRLYGSVAVVLQDSVQTNSGQDILNYLLLSSELRGTVESPDYYFSPDNPDRDAMANLLLMTQGWRRLHVSTPAQPKTAHPAFLPEYGGLLVWGHITDRQTGAPAKNIAAWLSAPGQHFQLARSISDKDGNIVWDMGDLYGARELVVQTANGDSSYHIEITPPFADPVATNAPATRLPPPPETAQLLHHSIGAQAQNTYRPTLRQHFTRPAPTDSTVFYGRPDKRYKLDDYTRYTTMEEVIREYVKEVRLRAKKDGFEFYVQSDQANQVFFDGSPLILMDGVPTANAASIIRYDPMKMQKIEVVAKRYFVGGALYDGIVSCNTYQGDITGFTLDGNAYTLDYDGWQLHREFYSPVYDTKDKQESRIPDLRNVLYWSGDILTDQQGKQQLSFYSSDMPGRYLVVLQGITADGKAGSAIGNFTIR